MTTPETLIEAVLDDVRFTLEDLCRQAAVTPPWVRQRVDEGLLAACESVAGHWLFDAAALRRARLMARLEREFDAVPELAALVADLQAEVERLRWRLQRAEVLHGL